jgi:hypothetical protein
MARDKRIGWRARHLISQILRNKNQNVRRAGFNELVSHVSRRHRRQSPVAPLQLRVPGEHRKLTRNARHLLRHLRQAKTWAVARRILGELHRELEQRIRRSRIARTARRGVQAAGRGARATGRTGARAYRGTRNGVRKVTERHLTWAERRHAAHAAGTRRPPVLTRIRQTGAGHASRMRRRLRASWRYRAVPVTARQRARRAQGRPAPALRTPVPVRARSRQAGLSRARRATARTR